MDGLLQDPKTMFLFHYDQFDTTTDTTPLHLGIDLFFGPFKGSETPDELSSFLP